MCEQTLSQIKKMPTQNDFSVDNGHNDPNRPHKGNPKNKSNVLLFHIKSLEAQGVPHIYSIYHKGEEQKGWDFKDNESGERVVFK